MENLRRQMPSKSMKVESFLTNVLRMANRTRSCVRMLWLIRWDSSRMIKDGLQCALRAREPPVSLSWVSVRHTERFLAGRMTRVGQWRVPGKVCITPFWADNGWGHGQNGGLRSKGRCLGSQIPRTRWLIGWVKWGGTTMTMQATGCCSCL